MYGKTGSDVEVQMARQKVPGFHRTVFQISKLTTQHQTRRAKTFKLLGTANLEH